MWTSLARLVSTALSLTLVVSIPATARRRVPDYSPKNSWKGITPLRSSVDDVARFVGIEPSELNLESNNSFKVEGGEVAFSFISANLAKVYRAPRSLVGKVFTIYFTPAVSPDLAEIGAARGFKRCTEKFSGDHYYLVSDDGVAYQLRNGSK